MRSPIELPRRAAMLKQSSARLYPIQFKEVCSPSQLSPIQASPAQPRVYTDCSFELNDTSAYQHYSVDASACLVQHQSTVLGNVEGIPLSDDSDSDSLDSSIIIPSSDSSESTDTQPDSPLGSPIRPSSIYSPANCNRHRLLSH